MFSSSRRRGVLAGISLAAAVAALTACSGGAGAVTKSSDPVEVPGASSEVNAYLNELYDRAFEDDKTEIVIYGPSVSTSKPMFDAFSERFPGITVLPQDAPDSQTLTKLEAEAQTGSRVADLFTGGGPTTAQAAAEPGICTNAEIKTAPADFEVPYANDGRLLPFAYRYFTFIYNTDAVDEAEAPKTWEELLDPKWTGKLVIGDPTVAGGLRYLLAGLQAPEAEDEFGEAYLRKLIEQDLVIGTSESAVPADVAAGRGDVGIGVFSGYYAVQKAKGAPLGIVFPLEDGGNFLTTSSVCYIEDAPHADAALLYLNWLFTEEGQETLAEVDGSYGILPGSPGPLGAPAFDSLERLPFSNPDPEFNKPYFAVVDELFKK
ncbi:ABC transporter substrate-binding protein [Agromyces archimandritae]|uniref:Extracellular solute-binding protein n=1 Tax=Agromyces archimandritae TaxID=2781962 RepID=A0A975FM33_9MICO|nr:extracellular solute-binding protein [Agromyces archimandritae]QTX04407.1 extracellular solute-binding protein [Agromyces archimandritae]